MIWYEAIVDRRVTVKTKEEKAVSYQLEMACNILMSIFSDYRILMQPMFPKNAQGLSVTSLSMAEKVCTISTYLLCIGTIYLSFCGL